MVLDHELGAHKKFKKMNGAEGCPTYNQLVASPEEKGIATSCGSKVYNNVWY